MVFFGAIFPTRRVGIVKKLSFALFFLIFLVSIHAHARADVRSDMATGMPLSQVIRNALTANVTIEDIVTQCIAAGADCIPVIREAIAVKATSAYSIVHAAVKAKPDRAIDVLKAALGIPGVNPGSVITGAATAVSGNVGLLNNLRTAALNDGISRSTVDMAILVATTAPAGPAPGGVGPGGTTFGTAGIGATGGGGVASPSR